MSLLSQVMIVEDNTQLAEAIKSYFTKKNVIEVAGIANNSAEAIELLKSASPGRYHFRSCYASVEDGFVLLEHLNRADCEKKPEVLVLSSLSHESVIKRACDLGAVYYMVKPFTMEDLHERVQDILGMRSGARAKNVAPEIEYSIDQRLATLFLKIGIPSQNKGYQYLIEAIKMVIEKPDLINNITKKLYPGIGDLYDTSSINVERAMRHAIEVAWESSKLQNINELFECNVFAPNYKPANGEFIALVSTRLLNSLN